MSPNERRTRKKKTKTKQSKYTQIDYNRVHNTTDAEINGKLENGGTIIYKVCTFSSPPNPGLYMSELTRHFESNDGKNTFIISNVS